MLQTHPLNSATQRIETNRLFINVGCIRLLLGNGERLDREKVSPTRNPPLWITPMPFGGERNPSKLRGIFRLGA